MPIQCPAASPGKSRPVGFGAGKGKTSQANKSAAGDQTRHVPRASDGDAQSVAELTARLAKATGREALRLGTALTKARRAMNGG